MNLPGVAKTDAKTPQFENVLAGSKKSAPILGL